MKPDEFQSILRKGLQNVENVWVLPAAGGVVVTIVTRDTSEAAQNNLDYRVGEIVLDHNQRHQGRERIYVFSQFVYAASKDQYAIDAAIRTRKADHEGTHTHFYAQSGDIYLRASEPEVEALSLDRLATKTCHAVLDANIHEPQTWLEGLAAQHFEELQVQGMNLPVIGVRHVGDGLIEVRLGEE